MLWHKVQGAGGVGAGVLAGSLSYIEAQSVDYETNMSISPTNLQDGDLLVLLVWAFTLFRPLSPHRFPPSSQGTGWTTIAVKDSTTGDTGVTYAAYYAKYEAGVTSLTTNAVGGAPARHLCHILRPSDESNFYSTDFNYEFSIDAPATQILDNVTDKARFYYAIALGAGASYDPSITMTDEIYESFVGSVKNRYAYGIRDRTDNNITTVSMNDAGNVNYLFSGIVYADN